MAKCTCPDWRENIDQLDALIIVTAARIGLRGYTGKKFTHCPWCGSELTLEASDYKAPETTSKKTCKHLLRGAPDCVFCHRDQLQQELRLAVEGLANATQEHQQVIKFMCDELCSAGACMASWCPRAHPPQEGSPK